MKRALFVVASILVTTAASAQQGGGLPAVRSQVDALQASVDALNAQTGGLSALRDQVAGLQTAVNALNSATTGVPALRAQVTALQTAVEALNTQTNGLPALRAQVAALQTTVDALSAFFSQPRQTSELRGDFATTTTATCLQSQGSTIPPAPPSGFTNFAPNPGPTNVLTLTTSGVDTFNGDGTGTSRGHTVSVTNPGSGNASDVVGTFTYSVAGDGTVTIDTNPSNVTFVAGPLAGQLQRVSGVPTFTGHISKDGQTLTAAPSALAVETINRTDLSGSPVILLRVCTRSRLSIRIN